MHTKLVAVTQPFVEKKDSLCTLTAEEFIVYIARVSNPSNQLNTETGSRLLKYLIKHKHWSPYEHVSCTFEIKTSRAIAAQILRHRSFTFQEFSQRYAQSTEFESLEWRTQGKTNRQVGDEPVALANSLQESIAKHMETAQAIYNELITTGIAKECARMILPLNTQTTIYMSGTMRSWIHYIDLRGSVDTQKEHREIALDIKKRLEEVFPETFKAINELATSGQ